MPFLFVSASEFQSMYYGQTNRKIRSFFKALRKAARDEGGAIGYIEEFDAIGGARSGMNSGSMREGIVGVVNELLVQMQSFDLPTGRRSSRPASSTGSTGSCRPTGGAPAPRRTRGQHPHRRLHQPRRRPRSGAAAPRSLRPHHRLQPAASGRPPGDRRVLPRQEEPRRGRHGCADRRPHRRLHAGEDREAARRGADHRPALRPHSDERHRRAAGAARHRGRRRPRDGLPPRRASPHRHPRGGPRTDGGAHAPRREDGVDPSALRGARPRCPRRRGGAVPEDAERGSRPHRRRPRRSGRRDPGVRRGVERHLLRPRCGDHHRLAARRSARATGPACSAWRRPRSRRRRTSSPRCCPTSRAARPPRR